MHTELSMPEKLRLRSAFSRWMKHPVYYADEIASAQSAISDHQKYGWLLSVDRHGIPSATPPKNVTLSQREVKMFHSRLGSMNEQEANSARAALIAIGTRGFSAKIDSKGRLIAEPPKQVERVEVSWQAKAKAHKAFWAKKGQSAFKQYPTKII
jgi:hypothetical protein